MIILLAIIVISRAFFTADKKNNLYSLNCGSYNEAIVGDIIFNKDENFSINSQRIINQHKEEQIQQNTLLREGRISTDVSFNYELTLTAGIGEYEIILIFIENYFRDRAKRIFNIRLGDHVIFKNLDIYARSRNSPLLLRQKFILNDKEQILINGTYCANAYKYKTNSLVLEFNRIKGYDLPKLEGIMLYSSHSNQVIYQDNGEENEQKSRLEFNIVDVRFDALYSIFLSFKGLVLFVSVYIILICVVCYDDTQSEQIQVIYMMDQQENNQVDQDNQIQNKSDNKSISKKKKKKE